MSGTVKTAVFWAVIIVSAFLLWKVARGGGSVPVEPEISYSDFLGRVESGQVRKATITGSVVHGSDAKGGSFLVTAPSNQSAMLDVLKQHGVEIWFRRADEQSWRSWTLNVAPLVLLAALWFFMIRQMQKRRSGGDGSSGRTPPQSPPPRFGP